MREKLKYCSDPNLHGKSLNILIYSYTDKFLGENQLKKTLFKEKINENTYGGNRFSFYSTVFFIIRKFTHEHKHKLLEISSKFREHFFSNSFSLNPLNASVALIQKPVNWFAQQINWLVPMRATLAYNGLILMIYSFNIFKIF